MEDENRLNKKIKHSKLPAIAPETKHPVVPRFDKYDRLVWCVYPTDFKNTFQKFLLWQSATLNKFSNVDNQQFAKKIIS